MLSVVFLSVCLILNVACSNAEVRFAKALVQLPNAVRIFVPNLSPTVSQLLSFSSEVAQRFANNPNAGTFQNLYNSWGDVRDALSSLHNGNIDKAIALVDLLFSQVDIPIRVSARGAAVNPDAKVVTHFDPAVLKQFEQLVNVR